MLITSRDDDHQSPPCLFESLVHENEATNPRRTQRWQVAEIENKDAARFNDRVDSLKEAVRLGNIGGRFTGAQQIRCVQDNDEIRAVGGLGGWSKPDERAATRARGIAGRK